jgi:hypothetical protein
MLQKTWNRLSSPFYSFLLSSLGQELSEYFLGTSTPSALCSAMFVPDAPKMASGIFRYVCTKLKFNQRHTNTMRRSGTKRRRCVATDCLDLYSVESSNDEDQPATTQQRRTRYDVDEDSGRITTTNSYHTTSCSPRKGALAIAWQSTPDDQAPSDPAYDDFLTSITLEHEPRRRTQAVRQFGIISVDEIINYCLELRIFLSFHSSRNGTSS